MAFGDRTKDRHERQQEHEANLEVNMHLNLIYATNTETHTFVPKAPEEHPHRSRLRRLNTKL